MDHLLVLILQNILKEGEEEKEKESLVNKEQYEIIDNKDALSSLLLLLLSSFTQNNMVGNMYCIYY